MPLNLLLLMLCDLGTDYSGPCESAIGISCIVISYMLGRGTTLMVIIMVAEQCFW